MNLTDRLKEMSGILNMFGEDANFFTGKTPEQRARGAGQIGWESVPFISEAVTVRDIKNELAKKDPNWWAVGLLGGAGVLGLVPLVGDIAGSAIRQGVKARNKVPAQVKEPTGVNPVMSYDEIPTITPEDLKGMKIGKTVGDFMKAGGEFTGIDSVPVDPRLMKGGTLFPALQSSIDEGVVWADPKATALAKNPENPDVIAVTGMMPQSHSGNIDMGMNLRNQVMAYVQAGRMSNADLKAINKKIYDAHTQKSSTGKTFEKLKNFTGFENPNYEEYLNTLDFETRTKIFKILDQAGSKKFNVPNTDKVLSATAETSVTGNNPRDTLLFYERSGEVVPSGHASYPLAYKGKLAGKYKRPVGMEFQFKDWWDETGQFKDRARANRAFETSGIVQDQRPDVISGINRAMDYSEAIQNADQARMVIDAVNNRWKTFDKIIDEGGASPKELASILQASPSSASLSNYSMEKITKAKRSGEMSFFKLGDNNTMFGIDNVPDYKWAGVDKLPEGSKSLVGVVNNEFGVKRVASPAIMTKALEENVTHLDAFAVPSAKYPNGYLPDLYGKYGFDVISEVPFDKDMFVKENGQNAFDDLVFQWRKDGWDESKGFPPVVVMEFKGNQNVRKNATTEFFKGGLSNFRGEKTSGIATTARGFSKSGSGKGFQSSQGSGILNNFGRNTGAVRDGNARNIPVKPAEIAKGILELTPEQIRNLQLNPKEVDTFRGLLK
tara:strand:+ start:1183 stop:3351 length:2169 start_codon:yes stop_codon:yes gene_type:complete